MSSTQNSVHDRIPNQELYSGPPIAIVVIVLVLLFFFLGFFSLYFCRCFLQNLLYSWHLRHSPSGTPVTGAGNQPNHPGIDPKIIQSFPTFPYSSVKDLRTDKYGLECAICLIEFENDDVLRMLTKCCHVFHQECIDLWLEKHKTCPVCRRSLDSTAESPEKSPENGGTPAVVVEEGSGHASSSRHSFCISIKDDDGAGPGPASMAAGLRSKPGPELRMKRYLPRFPRSHSTGHSINRNSEEVDRFTLNLPEHVHARILRGHNSSKSCTAIREFTCKRSGSSEKEGNVGGLGFREVSISFPSAPKDNIDRV